ncbi:hypothetical protein [Mesorhizobium sp. IMUNJ 23232]|uniref:hypothetical protein n=1 Tax=Mesorhizobium sp. IMUNJ 23232 TaxID=3376064 RepID=UPI0037AD50F5
MAISSFDQLKAFIAQVMTDLGADAEFAPHEEFWSNLSYDEFINGNVPGIGGQPVKILIVGDASQSQLIHSLKGEGIFAAGGRFRRMPAGGPFMSDEQIAEIAGWIDANCPEHEQPASV